MGYGAIIAGVIAVISAAVQTKETRSAAREAEELSVAQTAREERIAAARSARQARIRAAQVEAAGGAAGISGATLQGAVTSAETSNIAQQRSTAALAGIQKQAAEDIQRAADVAAVTSFVGTVAQTGLAVGEAGGFDFDGGGSFEAGSLTGGVSTRQVNPNAPRAFKGR